MNETNKRFDELREEWLKVNSIKAPSLKESSLQFMADWWLDKLHSEIQLEREKAFWAGYKAGNDKQISEEYLSLEEQKDLLKDLDKEK